MERCFQVPPGFHFCAATHQEQCVSVAWCALFVRGAAEQAVRIQRKCRASSGRGEARVGFLPPPQRSRSCVLRPRHAVVHGTCWDKCGRTSEGAARTLRSSYDWPGVPPAHRVRACACSCLFASRQTLFHHTERDGLWPQQARDAAMCTTLPLRPRLAHAARRRLHLPCGVWWGDLPCWARRSGSAQISCCL